MTDPDLAERLTRSLTAAGVDVASVEDVVQLSGGASRHTYSYVAVDGSGARRRLVLQAERHGGIDRNLGVVEQAAILRAAVEAGVPVAEPIASGDGGDGLGTPWLVSDHVDGESIARRILRDERYGAARSRLTAQCATALAAIHGLDATRFDLDTTSDPLVEWRDRMDELGHPHPAFELAFRWLADRRPPPAPSGFVHGDFRLGNLLVDESGLRAVLDWELAHAGDPIEDLGWLCTPAWRFGSPQPVAGVGQYGELLDAYEAASGVRIDPAHLEWWVVFGALRWGIICIVQAETHRSGLHRSVELATIGRRVCENELDVLELIS